MITRLEADHLVPMDASGSVHRPGIVDFEDGRIVWSGPSGAAPVRAHIATTAVSGVLMPGVIDIHCHTPMVLLRGAGEDLPVDRWLRNVMWPREARLTAHDVRAGMTLGAAELLRNGITASVEMYFFGEAIAEAAEAAGLRCVVTPPVIEGSHPARFGSWRDQLADIVTLRHQWAASDLIDVGLGPHAVYSTSEQCLRSVAEIASTHDLLVHIHVDEGRWEDAAVRERTGGFGAIQWLDHLGVLDARVLAAHCVWVTADDVETMAARRVGVAHCPCSNAKHGSGIAPVVEMGAAGVRVGLGTDGPASHHRLDPFEEMRTGLRMARARTLDSAALTAGDVLAMATRDAADAIGRPDLGRLTPGSRADMVALSLEHPAFHPVVPDEDDMVSRLVWGATPAAVETVWVNGRVVVDGGGVRTVDVPGALADVAARARRLAR